MAEDFIGCLVAVNCGPVLGKYEGRVGNVDAHKQLLTLFNPIRNGVPCEISKVTLRSTDIYELNVLSTSYDQHINESIRSESHKKTNSKYLLEQNGFSNTSSNNFDLRNYDEFFSDIPSCSEKITSNVEQKRNNNLNLKYRGGVLPRFQIADSSVKHNLDINYLVQPVDRDLMKTDFDFEANLALFDKKEVFSEMSKKCAENLNGITNKLSSNKRNSSDSTSWKKRTHVDYVTGSGTIVPAVLPAVKYKVIHSVIDSGLISESSMCEAVARASAELILGMLSDSDIFGDFDGANVVVLCGICPNQRLIGVSLARHLQNRGHKLTVFVPSVVRPSMSTDNTLRILEASQCNLVSNIEALSCDYVHLVVSCLHPLSRMDEFFSELPALQHWATSSLAPIFGVDPVSLDLPYQCILACALPVCSDFNSTLYLCDLGIPCNVIKSLGVLDYTSPFEDSFVVFLNHHV